MRMERVVQLITAGAQQGRLSMLLLLSQWLAKDIRAFNVFSYLTLRTVLAALTALVISIVLGPPVIRWLTAKKGRSSCTPRWSSNAFG